MQKVNGPLVDTCKTNPMCIDLGHKIPLLKNMRTSLIDPATPESVMERKSHKGKTQKLVVCLTVIKRVLEHILTQASFPTNLIQMAEPFTTVMTLITKGWIFGMV